MIGLFPLGRHLRDISLPSGFVWLPVTDARRPDVLVVADQAAWNTHEDDLPAPWLSVLPVVGCDASLSETADVIALAERRSLAAALASCEGLVARAAGLAWDAIVAGETDLLAFLAVRGRALSPTSDPCRPKVLDYAVRTRFPDLDGQAARLAAEGYLACRHVETVNDCPGCGSARLLVREVCPACAGSDVTDEGILHHFDCAYQGPESDFQDARRLRCPKCRRELMTLGVDYDRPAALSLCRTCGHVDQAPDVGFRCLDCGRRDRADRLVVRRLGTYHLTEAGRRAVTLPFEDGERRSVRQAAPAL